MGFWCCLGENQNRLLFQKEGIMKKAILVILMAVMTATPCLAQEIEPKGMFSLEETLWNVCRIGITINYKLKLEFYPLQCNTMGFYQGTVYWCDENECFSTVMSYINSPVVSIAYEIQFAYFYDLHIMQPTTGTGFTYQLYWGESCTSSLGCNPFFDYLIGIMLKVDDDWTPPEVE